ncbi:MAG: Hsp33 family molecular chaperone HslO [Legionellales bacterium]|nr:Hsp33 family molecular chaperone HslO [Legionellales bacterium]
MPATNSLQRFLFAHAAIRGDVIHLDSVYQTIIQQRPYPPKVKQLLGEALMACVLLVGGIKFEGEVSLQFQGDQRLPLLLVQCDHLLQLRGFANFSPDLSDEIYTEAFLQGKMVINLTPHQQTQTYQSIVPLTSASMSDNLMHYFAQSEQLPTKVWLAINEKHAAGILLQLMPEQDSLQREQFWEYAVHIGATITPEELLTLDNTTLLYRLYHETELRLYPERNIQFKCRCSQEKMQQVLTILGEQETQDLLKEKGQVDVNCEFCNLNYTFDAIDVALLFRK